MIELKGPDMRKARQLMRVAPKEVKRAEVAAIRRATTRVKKLASVEIRKRYVIKARDIKATLKTKIITSGSLVLGDIRSKGGSIPLIDFRVSIPKNGKKLKAQVLKENKLTEVVGMFARDRRVYVRKTAKSYPIKSAMGPSVPQMMGNELVVEELNKEAYRVLSERFQHEVEYRLGKLGG